MSPDIRTYSRRDMLKFLAAGSVLLLVPACRGGSGSDSAPASPEDPESGQETSADFSFLSSYSVPAYYEDNGDRFGINTQTLLTQARAEVPGLSQIDSEALRSIDPESLISADLEELTKARLFLEFDLAQKIILNSSGNWIGREQDLARINALRQDHQKILGLAKYVGIIEDYDFAKISQQMIDDALELASNRSFRNALQSLYIGSGFSPFDVAIDAADVVSIAARKKDIVGNPATASDLLSTIGGILAAGSVLDVGEDMTTAKRALNSVDDMRLVKVVENSEQVVYTISENGAIIRYAADGTATRATAEHLNDIIKSIPTEGSDVIVDLGSGSRFVSFRNTKDAFVITFDRAQTHREIFASGPKTALQYADDQPRLVMAIEELVPNNFNVNKVNVVQAFFPHGSLTHHVTDTQQLSRVLVAGSEVDIALNGNALADMLKAGAAPDELTEFVFDFFGDGTLRGPGFPNPLAMGTEVDNIDTKRSIIHTFLEHNKAYMELGRVVPHTDAYYEFRKALGDRLGEYFEKNIPGAKVVANKLTDLELEELGTTWSRYTIKQSDFAVFVQLSK